jgi:hypothetical protein
MPLTQEHFIEAAKLLNCEVASIMAVAKIESPRGAFLSTGEPTILYEPFNFSRLTKKKFDGKTVTLNGIIYPLSLPGKWNVTKAKYGPSSIQHFKLKAATALDREAALQACSWGKFQILAQNYKLAGFDTLQDFINAMYKDEYKHLMAFVNFLKNTKLDRFIRTKQWTPFAKGYNGPAYHRNTASRLDDYDYLIDQAYLQYKKEGY